MWRRASFNAIALDQKRLGRILEGKGQYMRHIKVRKVSDIDEDTFGVLLRQAAR